jgi:hypothetical protein
VKGLAVVILAKPREAGDIDFLILIEEQNKSTITDLMKKKFEVPE